MTYIRKLSSPLGEITLASDGEALTGLWLAGQKNYGATLDGLTAEKDLAVFDQAARWLDIYFGGGVPDFTPPLSLLTTPFRREVCGLLLSVPYGQTVTYGGIAGLLSEKRGGEPVSARAVGSAVGHNPISLIVPCHRVIGADGSLTGYAGGLERKRFLLRLEGSRRL